MRRGTYRLVTIEQDKIFQRFDVLVGVMSFAELKSFECVFRDEFRRQIQIDHMQKASGVGRRRGALLFKIMNDGNLAKVTRQGVFELGEVREIILCRVIQ